MIKSLMVLLVVVLVLGPFVAAGESIEDMVVKTLDGNDLTVTFISEAIHFHGLDDTDVVVEPGFYKVEGVEKGLHLIKVGEERIFIVKAELGQHEESLQEPVVVNVYGDVADEPDISVLMLQLPDGTQLVAEGSYSGIRPRGLRDRLRAARARIQQRAQQIRQRAQQIRRKAAARAKQLRTFNSLRKQAKAMPKLSQAQKAQLKQMAKKILQDNKGMLEKVARRVKNNRGLLVKLRRKGIRNLTQADTQEFKNAIFGKSGNRLRLSRPVESGQPISRGLLNDSDDSITLGISGDLSFGAGAGAGIFLGIPNISSQGSPALYGAWSYGGGTTAGGSINLDIGSFFSRADELDGCDYSVNAAYGEVADFGVSVVFGGPDIRTEKVPLAELYFSGLQIEPGAGLEASLAVYVGCATKLL